MSQLQDIQKTAREILELLCGLGQGEIDCNTEGQMKLEEILDSLIDKTVQSEQERILMEIEDLFKPNEWTVWNTGSKMIEKDKLISLITNKSDINNNKE